ncbi:MAG: hypothetical protein J3R72DRAFT_471396 [Linnemannia gamsii]|nr:MAG: hypothetical protein J3R72DRAFT_471396 [Linnemannia gamsii]
MSSKELLAEYTKLAARLEHINETLQEMNAVDIAQLIDKIRVVERKMSLVYTLFKQSVYFVTMQNAQQDQDQHFQQSQDSQQQDEEQQYQQQQQSHTSSQQQQHQQQQQEQEQLNQSQNQDHERYSQEQPQYQDHQQPEGEYDDSSPQQQQQQQGSSQGLRSSLRNSNDKNPLQNSIHRSNSGGTGFTSTGTGSGTTHPSRTSNAREEYQAATGNKSILALSRGHEGRSRWGNHYGYHSGTAGNSGGFDSDNNTNRPRYH